MITLPNYELMHVTLPQGRGRTKPAIVLTFAWTDVHTSSPPMWKKDNMRLVWNKFGLVLQGATEDDLFFPVSPIMGAHDHFDRPTLQRLIHVHQGIHVCAFSEDGDPLASMAFSTVGTEEKVAG